MNKPGYTLTLLIVALVLLLPSTALPCQCGVIGDDDQYDAVFEGRVERISRLEPWWQYTRRNAASALCTWLNVEWDLMSPAFTAERERLRQQDRYGLVVTFSVTSSSKGISGKAVDVRTGLWMGDCGYRFEAGESYRVFAYKRSGSWPLMNATGLETSRCTRTRKISGEVERSHSDLFAGAYPAIWTPIILAGLTGLTIGWLAQRIPVRRLAQDVVACLAAEVCGVIAFGVLYPVFGEGGMFAEAAITAQTMIAVGPMRWVDSLAQSALLLAFCLALSPGLRVAGRFRPMTGAARYHGLVCGAFGGTCSVALPILIAYLRN